MLIASGDLFPGGVLLHEGGISLRKWEHLIGAVYIMGVWYVFQVFVFVLVPDLVTWVYCVGCLWSWTSDTSTNGGEIWTWCMQPMLPRLGASRSIALRLKPSGFLGSRPFELLDLDLATWLELMEVKLQVVDANHI